eukprot:CAMPEP_0119291388 /NCGR_PEP_ID=MMETSP1329-20130426/42382_1 /TAXON_ID=114041 /ORGANISM="Genus nov. species nov., Strain RCC1024" /LENGTH=287 /DNA_ID=CAMNT_0007292217 /DNA_START=140 /DNA_END=1000 /DNA_ORIENTATION=-
MDQAPVIAAAFSAAQFAVLAAFERCVRRAPPNKALWLAPKENAAKRATEIWFLAYAVVWIGAFAAIVGFQLYESFGAASYFFVCGGLAAPLVLQPIVYPALTQEADRPLADRYALKANVWLGIFGFVGNYWYTHYFYSVLRASYTMPAWRLNDVPIAMYFATHFYFCFYHVLSNAALRRIDTGYEPGARRFWFRVGAVCAMAYLTAFLETFTISGFPYYSFENRDMAYTVGSAFYGIYFIVSFPMFLRVDETPSDAVGGQTHSMFQVVVEALASAMLVLCLLDFVRL